MYKEFIQVAVMDKSGKVLRNTKISNKDGEIRRAFAGISEDAKYVMESSSVWDWPFGLAADDLRELIRN